MTLDRGCVFFNFGTKCLSMLFVALHSLRLHYDGPVTVFVSDVPDEARLRRDLASLDVDVRPFARGGYTHSSLRARIVERSPYRTTLAFDTDLLFRASPEPLWQPIDEAGLLVTRFFPNPYGIEGRPEQPGAISRIKYLNNVARLVTPDQLERATDRLINQEIDINVGVMGFSRPRADAFLAQLSQGIDEGARILLVDEMLTNVLIADHPHHLADERWNCPADEMFRRTALGDAKIVHYFADGLVLGGRRLGRNRDTEAGSLWLDALAAVRAELPIEHWAGFDDFVV